MGWLKFAAVAMCVWGTTTFAALPGAVGGERQELQTISSWMAHLNFRYGVDVSVEPDLSDPNIRNETLKELQLLKEVLAGQALIPTGSLMFISCANIVCGGGDGGKCIKCSAED